MLQRTEADGVVYYQSPLLKRAGIPHAFSTRIGGVSPRPFESLNLGNPSGCDVQDDEPRVQENYRIFHAATGCTGERCWVKQVHGADVAVVESVGGFVRGNPADALVTADAGAVLAIRVADCVPVLISTSDGRVVAAAHAGWRGVVAGVVPATVNAMRKIRALGRLIAAIGPCISLDAFEVGAEVADAFDAAFGDPKLVRRTPGGKARVDLQGAVRAQLLRAGLDNSSIDGNDRCTVRDADEFYSHRRDRGVTGRLAAMIRPAHQALVQ